jgi:hypothetical protein
MAMVSIKNDKIFWNEAFFTITNITQNSKGLIVHVKGNYEDLVQEYDMNIKPIANDRFTLGNKEFLYCTPKFPPAP